MGLHAILRQFETNALWLLQHWEALEQWEMLRVIFIQDMKSAVALGADPDAQLDHSGHTVWQHIDETRLRLRTASRADGLRHGAANFRDINEILDLGRAALELPE